MTTRHFFEADSNGNIPYSIDVLYELEEDLHSSWIEANEEVEAFMEWYDHDTQTRHDIALNTSTINKLTATAGLADDIVISNIPSGSVLTVDDVVVASDITTGHVELTFSESGEYYVKIISEVEYFEEQWMVTVAEAS